jgi:hypothetical protein
MALSLVFDVGIGFWILALVAICSSVHSALQRFHQVAERLNYLGNAASVMQEGFSGPVKFENRRATTDPVVFDVLQNSRGGAKIYPEATYDITLSSAQPIDATLPMEYKTSAMGTSRTFGEFQEMLSMTIKDELHLTNVRHVYVATSMNATIVV